MANILEEFLVNVRYQVDAASQQNFLASLKRAQGSIAVIATEIVALSTAIVKMVEHFAEAGEKFYFMSQRLGSSVTDIQAAAFAMSNLGASSEEAHSALEGLGRFTRSYGPIATNFFAHLGITAKDAAGQMRQVGDFLRSKGFEPGKEGTMGYAMGLRWGQMLMPGASEQALRAIADPEYTRQQAISQ